MSLSFDDISFAQQIAAYVRTDWKPNMPIDTRYYQDPRKQQTFCPDDGGCCVRKEPVAANVFGGVGTQTPPLFANVNNFHAASCSSSPSPWQAVGDPRRRPLPEGLQRDCAEDWPLSAPGTIVGLLTHVPGRKQ